MARREFPTSMISDKVITNVTLYVKNKKWIWNKTFEKWKKTMNDPFQPEKMAEDTMWITIEGNKITMRYKKPLKLDKETGKYV